MADSPLDDENPEENIFQYMPNFKTKQLEEDVPFTEDQINDFRNSYNQIDKHGVGSLSTNELGALLRSVGMNPSLKLIDDIVDWIEQNNKFKITFDEFLLILEKVWEPASVDELRSAIEVIDPNMDGVTTVEQLKYFLVDLGETFSDSEFKEFIKSLPIDDDGRILTEDIVKLLGKF